MSLIIKWSDWEILDSALDKENQINFWKTKEIYSSWNNLAIVHKNIITAYDNPEFSWDAPDKWTTSAYSSVLLFKRIENNWVKTSNIGIINPNTTLEIPLDMLPFEIIWRRYHVKWNSLEKREPWKWIEWQKYPEVIYEVCIKWSVKTIDWEIVHDPFIKIDSNFSPVLDDKWMPILIHSKEPRILNYVSFVQPNKLENIPLEDVKNAIKIFSKSSQEIRNMVKIIQETTLDTYAQIGRLNADGKVEIGLDIDWKLILWDTLELDSLRNMSLGQVEINWEVVTFSEDLLWKNLYEILWDSPNMITRIIKAHNSDKQMYRNLVWAYRDVQFDNKRKQANNNAASQVTNQVYIPVALALSNQFGLEVWYTLTTPNLN